MGLRIFFVFTFIFTLLFSKPGDVDTGFGTEGEGIVHTNIDLQNESQDHSYAVALTKEEEILVAGSTEYGPTKDFALVKYKKDGTLDDAFATEGRAVFYFTGETKNEAYAIAIQEDGKIVLGGYSGNDFALVRCNSDGSIDTGFGNDGFVVTSLGGDDQINDLAIDDNGYIVAVGVSVVADKSYIALIRYKPNGEKDPDFGSDGGIILLQPGDSDAGAYSVTLDNNQNIVVTGYSRWFGTDYFTTLRYKSDGTPDESFDNHETLKGMVFTHFGHSGARAKAVAIQDDGKIVVAGYDDNGNNFDMAMTRYNTDGSVDQAFGEAGKVIYRLPDVDTSEEIYDLVMAQSGKIVVSGSFMYEKYALVSRFKVDGTIDTAFGEREGTVTFFWDGSAGNSATGIILQKDGKIVVTGPSSTKDFSTGRLLGDVSLVPIYYLLQ